MFSVTTLAAVVMRLLSVLRSARVALPCWMRRPVGWEVTGEALVEAAGVAGRLNVCVWFR